jgi:hypothetical protein
MKDDGLTLLDLLVMLAAGALMMVVVVPWSAGAMSRMRADSAADQVVDAIAEARALAIHLNKTVPVIVDDVADSLEVQGGRFRRLPGSVRMAGPPAGRDGKGVILFHGDGSCDGGQVVVASGDTAWAVAVESQTGRVRRIHAAAR